MVTGIRCSTAELRDRCKKLHGILTQSRSRRPRRSINHGILGFGAEAGTQWGRGLAFDDHDHLLRGSSPPLNVEREHRSPFALYGLEVHDVPKMYLRPC
ncbi:hypothetical protein PM082_006655 [Marasmius tenuissimus]|nr:hypothetical protein PM082_006655 [Marasmius tenuissimus]